QRRSEHFADLRALPHGDAPMPLADRFKNAPDRVKGAFTRLDTAFKSFFTPLREQHLGECYESLCKASSAEAVDKAIKAPVGQKDEEWRTALRPSSLVALIKAFADGDTRTPAKIVEGVRSGYFQRQSQSIDDLDKLTREALQGLNPY